MKLAYLTSHATKRCVKSSAARMSRLESRVEEIHDLLRALVAPTGSMTLDPRFAKMDGIPPIVDDGPFSPFGRSLGNETPVATFARFRFVSDVSSSRQATIPEEEEEESPEVDPAQPEQPPDAHAVGARGVPRSPGSQSPHQMLRF